ncbi:hypothetical protein LCGC14_0475810 [marine sediment metagenome]|uniref:Uncharacterized protein n=1 Tax=marine sediment metagenome TaxID=412755 RepID=A0A0F9SG09_9ZZZZ
MMGMLKAYKIMTRKTVWGRWDCEILEFGDVEEALASTRRKYGSKMLILVLPADDNLLPVCEKHDKPKELCYCGCGEYRCIDCACDDVNACTKRMNERTESEEGAR